MDDDAMVWDDEDEEEEGSDTGPQPPRQAPPPVTPAADTGSDGWDIDPEEEEEEDDGGKGTTGGHPGDTATTAPTPGATHTDEWDVDVDEEEDEDEDDAKPAAPALSPQGAGGDDDDDDDDDDDIDEEALLAQIRAAVAAGAANSGKAAPAPPQAAPAPAAGSADPQKEEGWEVDEEEEESEGDGGGAAGLPQQQQTQQPPAAGDGMEWDEEEEEDTAPRAAATTTTAATTATPDQGVMQWDEEEEEDGGTQNPPDSTPAATAITPVQGGMEWDEEEEEDEDTAPRAAAATTTATATPVQGGMQWDEEEEEDEDTAPRAAAATTTATATPVQGGMQWDEEEEEDEDTAPRAAAATTTATATPVQGGMQWDEEEEEEDESGAVPPSCGAQPGEAPPPQTPLSDLSSSVDEEALLAQLRALRFEEPPPRPPATTAATTPDTAAQWHTRLQSHIAAHEAPKMEAWRAILSENTTSSSTQDIHWPAKLRQQLQAAAPRLTLEAREALRRERRLERLASSSTPATPLSPTTPASPPEAPARSVASRSSSPEEGCEVSPPTTEAQSPRNAMQHSPSSTGSCPLEGLEAAVKAEASGQKPPVTALPGPPSPGAAEQAGGAQAGEEEVEEGVAEPEPWRDVSGDAVADAACARLLGGADRVRAECRGALGQLSTGAVMEGPELEAPPANPPVDPKEYANNGLVGAEVAAWLFDVPYEDGSSPSAALPSEGLQNKPRVDAEDGITTADPMELPLDGCGGEAVPEAGDMAVAAQSVRSADSAAEGVSPLSREERRAARQEMRQQKHSKECRKSWDAVERAVFRACSTHDGAHEARDEAFIQREALISSASIFSPSPAAAEAPATPPTAPTPAPAPALPPASPPHAPATPDQSGVQGEGVQAAEEGPCRSDSPGHQEGEEEEGGAQAGSASPGSSPSCRAPSLDYLNGGGAALCVSPVRRPASPPVAGDASPDPAHRSWTYLALERPHLHPDPIASQRSPVVTVAALSAIAVPRRTVPPYPHDTAGGAYTAAQHGSPLCETVATQTLPGADSHPPFEVLQLPSVRRERFNFYEARAVPQLDTLPVTPLRRRSGTPPSREPRRSDTSPVGGGCPPDNAGAMYDLPATPHTPPPRAQRGGSLEGRDLPVAELIATAAATIAISESRELSGFGCKPAGAVGVPGHSSPPSDAAASDAERRVTDCDTSTASAFRIDDDHPWGVESEEGHLSPMGGADDSPTHGGGGGGGRLLTLEDVPFVETTKSFQMPDLGDMEDTDDERRRGSPVYRVRPDQRSVLRGAVGGPPSVAVVDSVVPPRASSHASVPCEGGRGRPTEPSAGEGAAVYGDGGDHISSRSVCSVLLQEGSEEADDAPHAGWGEGGGAADSRTPPTPALQLPSGATAAAVDEEEVEVERQHTTLASHHPPAGGVQLPEGGVGWEVDEEEEESEGDGGGAAGLPQQQQTQQPPAAGDGMEWDEEEEEDTAPRAAATTTTAATTATPDQGVMQWDEEEEEDGGTQNPPDSTPAATAITPVQGGMEWDEEEEEDEDTAPRAAAATTTATATPVQGGMQWDEEEEEDEDTAPRAAAATTTATPAQGGMQWDEEEEEGDDRDRSSKGAPPDSAGHQPPLPRGSDAEEETMQWDEDEDEDEDDDEETRPTPLQEAPSQGMQWDDEEDECDEDEGTGNRDTAAVPSGVPPSRTPPSSDSNDGDDDPEAAARMMAFIRAELAKGKQAEPPAEDSAPASSAASSSTADAIHDEDSPEPPAPLQHSSFHRDLDPSEPFMLTWDTEEELEGSGLGAASDSDTSSSNPTTPVRPFALGDSVVAEGMPGLPHLAEGRVTGYHDGDGGTLIDVEFAEGSTTLRPAFLKKSLSVSTRGVSPPTGTSGASGSSPLPPRPSRAAQVEAREEVRPAAAVPAVAVEAGVVDGADEGAQQPRKRRWSFGRKGVPKEVAGGAGEAVAATRKTWSIASAIKEAERGKGSPKQGEPVLIVTEEDSKVRLRIVEAAEEVVPPWALATKAQVSAQLARFRSTIRAVAGGWACATLADGYVQGKGMYYAITDERSPFPPGYKIVCRPLEDETADPRRNRSASHLSVEPAGASGAHRSVIREMDRSRSLSQTTMGSEHEMGFFTKGVTVLCEGLRKSTDLNGKCGKVLGRQKCGDHLLVQVAFDGVLMAVKEAHLRPVCAAEGCTNGPNSKCANCTQHYCLKCACTCMDAEAEEAAQWVTDESSNSCTGCSNLFTVTRRRHHCRACGHLFCSACVQQRQMIAGFSTPQKVCQSCSTSISPSTRSWVPDSEAHECELCWADFTQKRRRHHCRACGNVFCGDCSSQRMRVQGFVMPQRVCTRCSFKRDTDAMPMSSPKYAVPKGYDGQELRVTLLMAQLDAVGCTDVFVKCRAKTNKNKWVGDEAVWPVVPSTCEPQWHVTRLFGCDMSEVSALEFRVWNSVIGENQYVGDATTPLSSLKPGKTLQIAVKCKRPASKGRGTAMFVRIPTIPPDVKNVFLVRHGQSRWNAAKSAGGSAGVVDRLKETDHPLSALGCEQAEHLCSQIEETMHSTEESSLGKLFSEVEIVYASPLTRATQTAIIGVNPVIRATRQKLLLTRYAREKRNRGGRDTNGSVQGEGIVKRVKTETDKLFDGHPPNVVDYDCIDPSHVDLRWWNDNAESKDEFSERLRELANLIRWSPHRNIMIVGHSHCFRGLVNQLISPQAQLPQGVSFSDLQHKKLSNCGMMATVLDFTQPHPLIQVDLVLDTTLVGKVKKKGDEREDEPESDEEQ